MGATAAVHPADPILQAYGLGKLDDASSASVSQHLESCDPCQRRVAELSSDEFLGRLQQAGAIPDKAASGWSPSATVSNDEAERPVVPPPPADTPPLDLADHADWEIIRELGRGGMGVVYLAKNRLMGRLEVLKVVGRHLIERPGVLDRFLREIQSAARLQHVNVVTAYAATRLGSSLVFAMEYVDGRDLMKEVKSKGPLPIAHACYFVHQAALGLQHAHERGMVHRDIKPANLILARDGKKAIVKVLDFGLAKVTSEGQTDSNLTREGQMLGTPDFIAPEQIRNAQSADVRADIYSLGCTLYFLLAGSPPFRREHLYDVYEAHVSTVATPLNLMRPEVPVELAAVAAKMMAKEPARRFQTPAQVAQALVPFFKTTGSTAQKPAQEIAPTTQPTRQSGQVEAPTAPTQAGTVESFATTPVSQRSTRPQPAEPKWESLIEFKETEPLSEIAPRPTAVPRVPRRVQMWLAAMAAVVVLGLLGRWVALDNRANTPNGNGEKKALPNSSERVPKTDPLIGGGPKVTKPSEEPSRTIVDSTRFTVLSGKWSKNGDELVQTDSSLSYSELVFGDVGWTDYDFTVDAMRVSGDNSFGLIFRCTGSSNKFTYRLAEILNTRCSVYVHERGESGTLSGYHYGLREGTWYTARVKVRGNHLVGSIYDSDNRTETIVFDIHDARYPRGYVGLSSPGPSIRFKNVKVTSPDGKVLWEGLPAVKARKENESPKSVDHPAPAPGTEGFVQLFNGVDLTGWTFPVGGDTDWSVQDGLIHGAATRAGSTIATLRKDYQDFHLSVTMACADDLNKQVLIRASYGAEDIKYYTISTGGVRWNGQTASSGEFELKAGGGLTGGSQSTTAGIRLITAPTSFWPSDNSWHVFEIIAEGSVIRTFLDSHEISAFEDTQSRFKRGQIALRLREGGSIKISEIRIKELHPSGSSSSGSVRKSAMMPSKRAHHPA